MERVQSPNDQAAEWLAKATKLKGAVVERLASMTEEQRNLAPAPGQWSASGVVEHLILLEEVLVESWRQKLLELPAPKVGLKSAALSGMVSYVFTKTSFRPPTTSELEPTEGISLDELKSRWDLARERLVAALPEDSRTAWILHPVFGPLSSDQMGKMLASHLDHHLRLWPTPKS